MFDQFTSWLMPAVYAATDTAAKAAKLKQASAGATDDGEGLGGLFGFIADHFFAWVGGVVIIILFYVLAKSASKAAKDKIVRTKGEEVPENALVLIERMTKIGVLTVGIVIAASINGINLGTVIGAVSLGIGFAIKDIIGNFLSSVVMLAQNRVRIGDMIQIGDVLGTIVSIDTRVTVIQGIDGTQVVVPNQTMLNQTLISYTTNPFRRLDFIVGVEYKADLAKVTSLIRAVLDKDPDLVPKPAPMVTVEQFGESSINIHVFFWIESNKNWQVIRSNTAYRVKKAFDEAGISIPFPIRTLKIDENDQALLKTIDSIKKGAIPTPAAWKSQDELKEVALKTQNEPTIPLNLFKPEAKPEPVPVPVPPTQIATPPKSYDEPPTPPAPHL